ncbi:MAG: Spo0B domain-containing protein [Bacillota bacterium]
MDTSTFLKIMSVQRHDFLNHLQVISGLVQLNKTDRVKEYISQVSREFEKLGRVGHIAVPEVAAALLEGQYLAGKHQVEVVFEINTNLEKCAVPGPLLGEVLEKAIIQSLECLVPPGIPNRLLRITLNESDKKYMLRLYSPDPGSEDEAARQSMADIGKMLDPYGGKAGIVVSGSGGEIFILAPRYID